MYNLRTKLRYFSKGHRLMELANKHHLGRKLQRSWLVSYVYRFNLTYV
jgi:hypothetical protein